MKGMSIGKSITLAAGTILTTKSLICAATCHLLLIWCSGLLRTSLSQRHCTGLTNPLAAAMLLTPLKRQQLLHAGQTSVVCE